MNTIWFEESRYEWLASYTELNTLRGSILVAEVFSKHLVLPT